MIGLLDVKPAELVMLREISAHRLFWFRELPCEWDSPPHLMGHPQWAWMAEHGGRTVPRRLVTLGELVALVGLQDAGLATRPANGRKDQVMPTRAGGRFLWWLAHDETWLPHGHDPSQPVSCQA